jgi:basic membrane protein A
MTPATERQLRVGLVLGPAGVEDPYNRGPYLGMERAVEELGIKGRVLTPAPREGYLPSFSLLARQKHDLVIGVGVYEARTIEAAAAKFPETSFAILDTPYEALEYAPGNVQGLIFREEEVAYLAGFLAALTVALDPGDNVISSVAGASVPPVERFIAGYQAGAKRADPSITTLNGYTDDFLDPAKGRSVALSQIAKGSRVVFQVADACGLGALEAAMEQGVWGIGVDTDQSFLGKHILTSAVKRMDVAVFSTIEELKRGTLATGGNSVFSLGNGGVELGKISPAVPTSIASQLETVRRGIVAGEIAIPIPLRDQRERLGQADGGHSPIG